jgi:hypothetical protein
MGKWVGLPKALRLFMALVLMWTAERSGTTFSAGGLGHAKMGECGSSEQTMR